jgi:hypothetical protein
MSLSIADVLMSTAETTEPITTEPITNEHAMGYEVTLRGGLMQALSHAASHHMTLSNMKAVYLSKMKLNY